MKKYLIITLGGLLILGCSTNKNTDISKDKFVKFTNSNLIGIKKDDEVYIDRAFTIRIPNSLKAQKSSVSYHFLQNLEFKNNQRIIILYIPNKKFVLDKKIESYSRDEFESQLRKLNILEGLQEINFRRKRHFNIVLLENNFFVMFCNIQEKNIDDFNYSINSVKLNENLPN
jgi:hypothetical protein